jgi:hypothetical protein
MEVVRRKNNKDFYDKKIPAAPVGIFLSCKHK